MAKFEVGGVYPTRTYGGIEVVDKRTRQYLIRFINTGFKRWVKDSSMYNGNLRDPYHPTVAGIGYIGDGQYSAQDRQIDKPCFDRWYHMINRCYNPEEPSYKFYGGVGVTVCDEWHCFQNFAEWYNKNSVDGYDLDKDLLSKDSRVYGPNTCCFIPREINRLIVSDRKRKSNKHLPIGVIVGSNGYKAKVKNHFTGKEEYYGPFESYEEPAEIYKRRKLELVRETVESYYSNGLLSDLAYEALLRWEPC